MDDGQRLLDKLWRLRLVLSADMAYVREDIDNFLRMADAEQIRQFEAVVVEVRTLTEELERELSYIEYLVATPLNEAP